MKEKSRRADRSTERQRSRRKKEMAIVLKSEPIEPAQAITTRAVSESKRKPRDFKKKGTRGSSWVG